MPATGCQVVFAVVGAYTALYLAFGRGGSKPEESK